MVEEAIVRVERIIRDDEAMVNITWQGQNGDLPDPVSRDANDGDVKQWVTEAVRTGSVPGIAADPNINLRDFVVDRFPPNEVRPHSLIQVRPKTPFGETLTVGQRIKSAITAAKAFGYSKPDFMVLVSQEWGE